MFNVKKTFEFSQQKNLFIRTNAPFQSSHALACIVFKTLPLVHYKHTSRTCVL
jgi:hypothetical protein